MSPGDVTMHDITSSRWSRDVNSRLIRLNNGDLNAGMCVVGPLQLDVNGEQSIFHRRHVTDSIPSYMKPTVGSTQKSWINRSAISRAPQRPSSSVLRQSVLQTPETQRPYSSVYLSTIVAPDNNTHSTNHDVIPAVSRHNSVGVSARPVLSRFDTFPHPTNTDSPVSELPVIGSGAVRPDSRHSADSATPRSNNAITTTTTRRQQRIDLDLRHSAVGTNGSRASPASHDSTSRPAAAAGRPRFGTVSTHVVGADTADWSKNGTVPRAVSSYVPRVVDRTHGWSDMTVLRQMTSFTAAGHMPVTSLTTSHVTPCQRTVSIGNLSRLSDDNNNKNNNNISRRDVTDRLAPDVTSPADVTGRRTSRAVCRAGVDVRRPLAVTTAQQRQSVAVVQTVNRPATTTKSATTAKSPLVKSTSQPSFLALLMSRPQPGVKDTQHVNTRHNNTEHRQQQQQLYCDDDSELSDDDVDDDVSDDDEADKKRMIEDWLLVLEKSDLERPVSPVIEEDAPPQTDTAIHIVYEGD